MLVYDVEILRGPDEVEGGWENPEGMGFGSAVVYDCKKDLYVFFGPKEKKPLIESLYGHKVISFNGIEFDNKVVLGNDYDKNVFWQDYDILIEVCRSWFGLDSIKEAEEKYGKNTVHGKGIISLDGLAQGTLGLRKTGTSAYAPELIKASKWADLFAYNLNDVRLIWKLFCHIRTYGYLLDRNHKYISIEYKV